jgi:XTP/dITP diphosphohydrolase
MTLVKPLLIGTGNRDKARELAELLEGLPWTAQTLADYPSVPAPEEDGQTFEANALLKARYYSQQFAVPCVADDSGLMVDSLGGAPGVLSARYAGEECDYDKNNEKLLGELSERMWHERAARFVCCAAFAAPDGRTHVETGTCAGHIAAECFGQKGFGYDPIFVPEGYDLTFGEMSPLEKHALSHRGEAFRKIRKFLETWA